MHNVLTVLILCPNLCLIVTKVPSVAQNYGLRMDTNANRECFLITVIQGRVVNMTTEQ